MSQRRKYDPNKVLAAVALHPTNLFEAARVVGCSKTTILSYLKRMDSEAGRTVIERKFRPQPMPEMTWNDAAVRKLAAILTRVPSPSNQAISVEMGCTEGAVQTAMSRFGFTKRRFVTAALWPQNQRPFKEVTKQLRNCMNCERPFGSEGKFNRLCTRCGGVGSINYEESNCGA
jgi:hypothetical protein